MLNVAPQTRPLGPGLRLQGSDMPGALTQPPPALMALPHGSHDKVRLGGSLRAVYIYIRTLSHGCALLHTCFLLRPHVHAC